MKIWGGRNELTTCKKLSCLVSSVAVGVVLVILYDVFSVEYLFRHIGRWRRVRGHSSQFLTVHSTNLDSLFDKVDTHKCSSPSRRLSGVQWNNHYWQEVRLRDLYLYSAFYDVRYRQGYHFVRVLASSKGYLSESVSGMNRDKLYCHLWTNDTKTSTIVDADIKEIWIREFDPDPPYKTYHSYLISCPVPHNLRVKNLIPAHVSISADYCEILTNFLPVTKDGLEDLRAGMQKDRFIVCVKGLNFQEDISNRIVEWMELNLILGTSGIDFYVYSIHPKVLQVLEYYESIGAANIISITLPGDQPNDERRDQYLKYNMWQKRRNELIPYNDCLYRNMYSHNFVIPLDIDEIILPKKDFSWPALFNRLFRENHFLLRDYASFSVPNVYFYNKWNTTRKQKKPRGSTRIYAKPATVQVPSLHHMLDHLQRTANFSKAGHHVKSFVSTKNTLLTFNHYALRPLRYNMSQNLLLDRNLVQMNHYQEKCSRYIMSQCINNFDVFSAEDDIILRYEKELKENIFKTWGEIRKYYEIDT